MRTALCVHLGNVLARASCNCPRKDTYTCIQGHGAVQPQGACETCKDYSPQYTESNPGVRHLLYHLYPLRANRAAWQWNVTQLLERAELFNGLKIVYISRDGATDSPDMVREALGPTFEVRVMNNNPAAGEVQSWIHAWSTLLQHVDGYLFYGHGKGVSHPFDPNSPVYRWTALLYEMNLDYYSIVADRLAEHSVAGSLLIHGAAFPQSYFFYTGTFFWTRISDAKKKAFELHFSRWGVEAWPGRHFQNPGLVFFEGGQEWNLYKEDRIKEVEGIADRFRDAHKLERGIPE